jgi:hypothetical protein
MTEQKKYKKYVVVLAHADGWGALSANKVVKHIHDHYPDVGVYLVVSQATKNQEGRIATKIDDLKTPRQLKETNLLEYFQRLDERYERMLSPAEIKRIVSASKAPDGLSNEETNKYFFSLGEQLAHQYSVDLLTFKQLAKRYCADQEVHYTTKGGPKGGAEVAAVVEELEKQYGHGPEVLLSVDTMAILPKDLLEKYNCFSTHPGPLDNTKIEGMQGTLRSLVNSVLYDREGKPLPADHVFGKGEAFIKGTLFMQHPELDKGPPIALTQSYVCPGMCAYQSRDEVYDALTDEMLRRLPVFLDKDARAALVQKATQEKEALDALPHQHIPELDPDKFATWQGKAIGFVDDAAPHGVDVVQNEIINPQYFKNQMRRFFPGSEADFDREFTEVYGTTIDQLLQQKDKRLIDPWARYYAGCTDITIRQHNPKTGEVIAEYKNVGPGKS